MTELQKKILVYIFLVSITEHLNGQGGHPEVSKYILSEKLGIPYDDINKATAGKNEYWYTCSGDIGLKDEGREIAPKILVEQLFPSK